MSSDTIDRHDFDDMVVLNMEAYENMQFDSHVYDMLLEGEREAEVTDTRFSPREASVSMCAAMTAQHPESFMQEEILSRYLK
ncbi:hypothetical protein [Bifidobacterium breve]|nr:hypothetical protein [Bifidobacterium breve]UVT06909.1 hypothetical protein HPH06_05630 [Bifidobacterium breve]